MVEMVPPAGQAREQVLENFLLYETKARFYLVAYTRDKSIWRVLKISRSEPEDLEARPQLSINHKNIVTSTFQIAGTFHSHRNDKSNLPNKSSVLEDDKTEKVLQTFIK